MEPDDDIIEEKNNDAGDMIKVKSAAVGTADMKMAGEAVSTLKPTSFTVHEIKLTLGSHTPFLCSAISSLISLAT